ncbi:hypothetical protein MNBD_BACTEROID03-1056 [hydrothermal vent metagenome]|uniref:Uncharacterized protein n=1 Tax=hydrothermal vent metagenome TaxID=652676 RepID=A0A3B0TTI9_9ZZZZ
MELSDKEIAYLGTEHRKCRDCRMADRIKAVLLLAKGFGCMETGEILLLNDDTVRGYRKHYLGGGVPALLGGDRKGKRCAFGRFPIGAARCPSSGKDLLGRRGHIIDRVRTEFSVGYPRSGTTAPLKRTGYVYRRPKMMPCKAVPMPNGSS